MKNCTQCHELKATTEFHKDRSRADGFRDRCKVCVKAYMSARYKKNAKRIKTKVAEWVDKNRQRHNAKCAKWVKANPAKVNARTARRYACKTQATPVWLTDDDHWMIEQAYDIARLRTTMLGVKFEVDHIIPLRGRKVCGLHVPWNLQITPLKANRVKSNSFEVI